jgi:hypothetical protein
MYEVARTLKITHRGDSSFVILNWYFLGDLIGFEMGWTRGMKEEEMSV